MGTSLLTSGWYLRANFLYARLISWGLADGETPNTSYGDSLEAALTTIDLLFFHEHLQLVGNRGRHPNTWLERNPQLDFRAGMRTNGARGRRDGRGDEMGIIEYSIPVHAPVSVLPPFVHHLHRAEVLIFLVLPRESLLFEYMHTRGYHPNIRSWENG